MRNKERTIFNPIFFPVLFEGISAFFVSIFLSQKLSDIVTYAINAQVDAVFKSTIILLGIVVIFAVLRAVVNILIQSMQAKEHHLQRVNLLEQILKHPLHVLFRAEYGDLVQRVNKDLPEMVNMSVQMLPQTVVAILLALGYLAFLATKSFPVFISLALLSVLQFVPPLIVKKYMEINYEDCQNIEAEITDLVAEAVEGHETIKLFSLKTWWLKRMADLHKNYLTVGRKTDGVAAIHRSMNRAVQDILSIGIYPLLGFYVIKGWCSLDIAIQAAYLSSSLFGQFKTVFEYVPKLIVANKAKDRVFEWRVDTDHEISEVKHVVYENDNSAISLKNVDFGYDNEKIFDNLNFQFRNDRNYLVTGGNGAGKSTMFRLISGAVSPQEGYVTIDDYPTCEVDTNRLVVLPQNDPEFSISPIELFTIISSSSAAQMANIAVQLGLDRSQVYTSTIDSLSGGERKKIFLAAAFGLESKWLLLDEPSNSLDSKAVEELLRLIDNRQGVIVISHDSQLNQVVNDIVTVKDRGIVYETHSK